MSAILTSASVVDLELPAEGVRQSASDRRDDIDAKQQLVAQLLKDAACDGLLVLDQINLAWLSSGAVARSVLDSAEQPALYFTPTQRWLLSSNVESQRMFDEELDAMGFLLKEWPWHWGREQLLADLLVGRRVACDEPFRETQNVSNPLRTLRRALTPYEQACIRQTGKVVAHALEATCRTANPGDTERELAGQISHRLYRRGATPAMISVAADGRSRTYRRHGFTSAGVQKYAVLSCTARKYGLHVTAARAFSFGPPEEAFRKEHLTACKIASTYIASTWPDAGPKEMFNSARRVYLLTGFEHEWQLSPHGWVTGRMPVEMNLMPDTAELLRAGQVATWGPTVGAATCCDSYLISDSGPKCLTPTEQWPLVSLRISGAEVVVPNVLVRELP